MVENRPILNILTYLLLILGVVIVAFPVYLDFVSSTYGADAFAWLLAPMQSESQFM